MFKEIMEEIGIKKIVKAAIVFDIVQVIIYTVIFINI